MNLYYTKILMCNTQIRRLTTHTPCNTQDFCSEYFFGVPFNISSYALLTHFVYTLGDYHIYQNHLAQVEGLLRVKYEQLHLAGYQSHGKIAAPVAV